MKKAWVGNISKWAAFLFLLLALYSCSKEQYITDPGVRLRFSVDTLRFDTVFTSRGSATRFFKVFNTYDQYIRISQVSLKGTNQSRFRLNVDGIPGPFHQDVTIPPGDSIYIFAEVTVDPDQPLSSSPFIIEDQLEFIVNGQTQQVVLEAWGQNANYIPNRFNQGNFSLLSCNLGEVIWSDPKPYVIYGILFVDSCTLTIPAGTRIYVHGGLGKTPENVFYNDGMLFFLERGRLKMEGTIEQPIVVEGDRLEPEFRNVPGQWAGIRFGAGSFGPHVFRNVHLKNSLFGIYADSTSRVELENSIISNTTASGLIGIRADIQATNCLFYDNFGGGVNLLYGGNYRFRYCTFSNDGLSKEVLSAQNHICRSSDCSTIELFPLQLEVVNSIMHNGGKDVLNLINLRPEITGFFNYSFVNSVLRVEDVLKKPAFADFYSRCTSCVDLKRQDRLFLNVREKDFSLDTLSVARGVGMHLPSVTTDLKGQLRKMPPDAGCFEFQE
jgi:hypothetical protein